MAATTLTFPFTVGCGSGVGSTAAVTPAGTADAEKSDSSSLYGKTTYKVLAVLKNKQHSAKTLPTLRMHGSPKSTVNKLFSPVIKQYEEELVEANRRLSQTIAEIGKTSIELDQTQQKLTDDYETMRPKEGELPARNARNPLRDLSKVRAAKTKADEWYKESHAERIDPVKAILKSLYTRRIEDRLKIEFLKAGFKDRLFDALESIPEKDLHVWTTSAGGTGQITVPNSEPWAVWAETTHSETVAFVTEQRVQGTSQMIQTVWNNKYEIESDFTVTTKTYPQLKTTKVRWLLNVPDDLDSNQQLIVDELSAFDLQDVTIESGSDGPYLTKGGPRP